MLSATVQKAKGDIASFFIPDATLAGVEQRVENTTSETNFNLYEAKWLGDYVNALHAIPENTEEYVDSAAMMADPENNFFYRLKNSGRIQEIYGWYLKVMDPSILGDELISNNSGTPGVDHPLWSNGVAGTVLLAHSSNLLDIDRDGVADYEFKPDMDNIMNYGVAHGLNGEIVEFNGGAPNFVAVPEPSTLGLMVGIGAGLYMIRKNTN